MRKSVLPRLVDYLFLNSFVGFIYNNGLAFSRVK